MVVARIEAVKMGWTRPCDGTIKSNTDASICCNKMRLVCVFRDGNGCALFTGMECKIGCLSKVATKLHAISFSLQLADDVEYNSFVVVGMLGSGRMLVKESQFWLEKCSVF